MEYMVLNCTHQTLRTASVAVGKAMGKDHFSEVYHMWYLAYSAWNAACLLVSGYQPTTAA